MKEDEGDKRRDRFDLAGEEKNSLHLSSEEYKQRHHVFRVSDEFYQLVIESLEDYAVFTTDEAGMISSWNIGAEKLIGFREEEIIGQNVSVLFTPEDIAHGIPVEELKVAMQKGRFLDERYHMRKDGTRFWASGLTFPLRDRQNTMRGFTKIMRDLTLRKELEQHKDDFINIATHELKTPLATIKLLTEVAQRQASETSNKEISQSLEKINLQIDKLNNLMVYLLDASQMQLKSNEIEKEKINLNKFLAEIIKDIQSDISSHKIIYEEIAQKNYVEADKNKLLQVLNNLIYNAIKYSPGENKVIVKINTAESHVLVSIEDFGIGIKESKKYKLFQRFARTNNAKESNISGIGLGLYIASEIIKVHEGKIWIESKDKGCIFCFSIPLCS